MPHVTVKLAAGRSEDQKQKLADEITRAVTRIAGCEADSVSVAIDVPTCDWMERVYRPEILPQLDRLYKRPGYDPFKS